jgi:shikimate dehydrogenase
MQVAAFRSVGLPHSYTAIDVPTPTGLRRMVGEIRRGAIAGANVTIPYKRTVLELVDEIAPSAAEVGGANVLSRSHEGRVVAHNTDAEALAAELSELGMAERAGCAVILGAGGAALAAVAACKRLGFKIIGVTTRSWFGTESVYEAPAAEQVRALGALASPWPVGDGTTPSGKASGVLRMQWGEFAAMADLVIQATSAGMIGADPGEDLVGVVPWTRLATRPLVYDVVYNPRVTPFLREAAKHGLRAEGGLGMLVRQAALSFAIWTGIPVSLNVMRSAAEEALSPPGRPAV